jgi:hypothetical protein
VQGFSHRIYVQLARRDIAFFKFLLESRDNLAYLTVIDKYMAVVQVVCGPGFEAEINDFLSEAGQEIFLRVVFRAESTGIDLKL